MTHEEYIKQIAGISIQMMRDKAFDKEADALARVKFVYAAGGAAGVRANTYFDAWKDEEAQPTAIVEICATGEENNLQLAGTVIHHLAHVAAGVDAGHGKKWQNWAKIMGLGHVDASATNFNEYDFLSSYKYKVWKVTPPDDGKPVYTAGNGKVGLPMAITIKPCMLGTGRRGGVARGKGSGSRLRLFECECPVKVRVGSDTFDATCDVCNRSFRLRS